MREIKFRAFFAGEMITQPIGTPYAVGRLFGFLDTQGFNEFDKIMQYTGLKDKNGVEIYEGDLLQNTNPVWKKEIVSFVMEWDAVAARFSDYSPREDFEVIGNIYENEELLT